MDEDQLTRWLIGTVRARMAQHGLSYADLEARLRAIGVEENERNLRNKVMRGTFSAAFWVQCLVALGVKQVQFEPGMMGFVVPPRGPDQLLNEGEWLAEIYKVAGTAIEGDD